MNALAAPAPPARRAMTLADLDTVLAIEEAAYGFPWTRGNFVDSLAAGHLAEVLQGDALVGYFVAMPGVDEMHLLNITVAPRWQGQGWGSLLLEAVALEAARRGLGTLWLEVRASNVRAHALYARRGFASVGQRRGYYPAALGREDAILMARKLPHGAPDGLV